MGFGLSTWYPLLKEHTFKSTLIPLESEDIHAILNTWQGGDIERSELVSIIKENVQLSKLEGRISEYIRDFPNGAFVKLETRSPKDSMANFNNDRDLHELLVEELGLLLDRETTDSLNSAEIALSAFMKMLRRAMRAKTAEDVLFLLLNSNRIHEDLTGFRILEQYGFTNNIILREWRDDIVSNSEKEFRGFVYRNRLNALTQYDYMVYHPDIVEKKDRIEERIRSFFNAQVRDSMIEHDTYVIDFYVGDDSEDVKIIGLNSFEAWTGACLFSWSENSDVFMNGPFEFRIVEKNSPIDVILTIPRSWRSKLIEAFPRVKLDVENAEKWEKEENVSEYAVEGVWDDEDRWYWAAVEKCTLM